MIKFRNFVAKEVFLRLNQGQRRKEVSGSMEKAPKKYPSLKEVSLATLQRLSQDLKILDFLDALQLLN